MSDINWTELLMNEDAKLVKPLLLFACSDTNVKKH